MKIGDRYSNKSSTDPVLKVFIKMKTQLCDRHYRISVTKRILRCIIIPVTLNCSVMILKRGYIAKCYADHGRQIPKRISTVPNANRPRTPRYHQKEGARILIQCFESPLPTNRTGKGRWKKQSWKQKRIMAQKPEVMVREIKISLVIAHLREQEKAKEDEGSCFFMVSCFNQESIYFSVSGEKQILFGQKPSYPVKLNQNISRALQI